jgi:hypothetical protein
MRRTAREPQLTTRGGAPQGSVRTCKPSLLESPKPCRVPRVNRPTTSRWASLPDKLAAEMPLFRVGPSSPRQSAAPAHPWSGWYRGSALLVVCAFGLFGCNSFRGLAQCRKVTASVNEVLEQARELHEEEPTAERYTELTKLLQGLETHLTGLTLADNDLKQAVDEYVKQLHRSVRDTNNYAQVLEQLAKAQIGGDAVATTTAEAELTKIRQRASRSLETAPQLSKRFREACKK